MMPLTRNVEVEATWMDILLGKRNGNGRDCMIGLALNRAMPGRSVKAGMDGFYLDGQWYDFPREAAKQSELFESSPFGRFFCRPLKFTVQVEVPAYD